MCLPSSPHFPWELGRNRHSGTLNDSSATFSSVCMSQQQALRIPPEPECWPVSSLNGAHSQDALGVLPEGSVSPKMIPSLEKVHIASNNLGYEGPLSSIWGISEGPAQLQSISRDLFRPLLGLTSAEFSPMSGHTLLCSRAPPTHRSPSRPVSLSITPQGPKLPPHYWQCLGGHLFFSGPVSYSSLQLPTGPGKAASPGGKPCSY